MAAFDHYMLHVEAGNNHKTCRLTDAQRCAWFLGVLPIAAKSPVRGALIVGSLKADAGDVARQAAVTLRTATATLKRAAEIGLLDTNDDGISFVHDFDIHNPEPRKDTTAAERQRRKRLKDKEEAARVTVMSRRDARDGHGDVTQTEVEVEVEVEEHPPLNPPQGENHSGDDLVGTAFPERPVSGRTRDKDRYDDLVNEWLRAHVEVVGHLDRTTFMHGVGLCVGVPATAENVVAVLERWEASLGDAA